MAALREPEYDIDDDYVFEFVNVVKDLLTKEALKQNKDSSDASVDDGEQDA